MFDYDVIVIGAGHAGAEAALAGRTGMRTTSEITLDPETHHGVPVITGTRVPVSLVVGSIAGGMDKEDVMREYDLTREQVEAALSYAVE